MRIFEYFIEALGWLRIVASPLIPGVVIGLIIYVNYPTTSGLLAGIFIALAGLTFGIIWATRVWRKHGTMNFLSKIDSTPELDNDDEKEKA